jgi:signal transduction histidine kinase
VSPGAVRHAKPSRVCLELTGSAFTLLLKVTDDGAGFDPRRGGGEDSLGLQGMRERAELIGAKLEIQSQPGKGAQLFLDWEAGEV